MARKYAAMNKEKGYMEWMKDIAYKPFGEESLRDAFILDNDMSLWWFMESWLFYYAPPTPIREFIGMKSLKHKNPSSLAIRTFFELSFNTRRLMWNVSRHFHPRDPSRRGALFITTYAWDPGAKGIDPYSGPVIEQLINRQIDNIKFVGIPVWGIAAGGIADTMSHYGNYSILESYYNKTVRKQVKNECRAIKKKWGVVRNQPSFQSVFEYRGRTLWPKIEKAMDTYFSSRMRSHVRDYYLIKRMIEEERPKVVVYPGETSEFGKMLFHVCRKAGVKTIAMQHGIFDMYLGCYHKKGEVSTARYGPRTCPIPDITCVYGKYYKDLLVREGNYPASSVVITGGQRFDRIINDSKKYSRAEFCSKHGIDESKKIIAYVTSPISEKINRQMADVVVEELTTLEGVVVVIKPHPNEDHEFYESISNGRAIVLRNSDLYELLGACDLVITYLSTAGLEVLMFDKPLVVLNLTGEPDRVSYARKGAAVGVYGRKQLAPLVERILNSGDYKKKVISGGRRFVKEYVYKCDGRASVRIADLIKRFMKE